jgi:hypothetical protein
MADGRRRSRRLLALDVRQLIWIQRFDAERYLRTGTMQEWISGGEIPDTPLMRQAMADLEREQEENRKRGHG